MNSRSIQSNKNEKIIYEIIQIEHTDRRWKQQNLSAEQKHIHKFVSIELQIWLSEISSRISYIKAAVTDRIYNMLVYMCMMAITKFRIHKRDIYRGGEH